MHRTRTSRGLTLVEVVIALAIFGMTAVVILQSVGYGLEALQRKMPTEDLHSQITTLRRSLLAIENRATLLEGGEGLTSEGERFRWEAEIFPTTVTDYVRVEVRVIFPGMSGAGERRQFAYYAFRPGWVEAEHRNRLQEQRREQFTRMRNQQGRGAQ